MKTPDDLTAMEQHWSEQLSVHTVGSCLEASDLIALAESKDTSRLPAPQQAHMEHVLFCSVCRNHLKELRSAEQSRVMAQPRRMPWLSFPLPPWKRAAQPVTVSSTSSTLQPPSPSPRFLPWLVGSTTAAFAALLIFVIFLEDKTQRLAMETVRQHRQLVEERQGLADTQRLNQSLIAENTKQATALRKQQKRLVVVVSERDQARHLAQIEAGASPLGLSSILPQDRKIIQQAEQTGNVQLPARLGTAFASSATPTLASKQNVEMLSPANTAVLSGAPLLQWKHVAGATRYKVLVFEDSEANPKSNYDSAFQLEQPIAGTGWQLLPYALSPGKFYSWEVRAYKGDALIARSTAKFKVLDTQTATSVKRASQHYQDNPLQWSILLAEYGLREDALQQLTTFQAQASTKSDPRAREIAQKLMKSLQTAFQTRQR